LGVLSNKLFKGSLKCTNSYNVAWFGLYILAWLHLSSIILILLLDPHNSTFVLSHVQSFFQHDQETWLLIFA
jgi:hypothetical protein